MKTRVKIGKVAQLPVRKPKKWRPKKGKVYRSDTGGTMRLLKGSLDPSKHDSSKLKEFG